ncbi:Oxidoreductase, aldo/keto reductase family [Candidatus Rhodobacter oscarellae]|uniref:Oxidoreductase, aldo/keto reductase family n=1 Tax=Candidatus Rhodobacter oscarellae TaxID=1675527 RepID=A0A0J9E5B8_9RHOB|nr:aldo/keto reductase [Candidatus Rhodobacter lobularis]KMW57024.1 Oxidoreductase, aldo/keto reductase family [Candidatus Rhodobacter lobularis]
MERIKLGTSDIEVSRLCLGSMSWGTRNTEAEAHHQIDRALDAGVDFIDTAEMYPTYPAAAETAGASEVIIGNWLAKSGRRDEVVIGTKVMGSGFLRDGAGYDSAIIPQAIEDSLKRLQTEVIDLYQLHWPMRPHYHFRKHWDWDPSGQDPAAIREHMRDVIGAMGAMIAAGKIRSWGLSNETTWGTAEWLRLCDALGVDRPVTIQNEYSLLCRYADKDLAELCCMENVGLLPFTPLIAGVLSPEHGPDLIPQGSRRSRDASLSGRVTERLWPATAAYRAVADKHGHDVNQMALAWTLTRPFVASTIFGASDDRQLELALGAAGLVLSEACLADIGAVHKAHPMVF